MKPKIEIFPLLLAEFLYFHFFLGEVLGEVLGLGRTLVIWFTVHNGSGTETAGY